MGPYVSKPRTDYGSRFDPRERSHLTNAFKELSARGSLASAIDSNAGTGLFLEHLRRSFVAAGGPEGDAGLTGRKIIVDTYGGMGRHGGGAFSGKDPSKVDRSAAYMARWVAKNIVASGLATECELQLAYAIGYPDPVSINVNTFGTNEADEDKIVKAVQEVFSFKAADIVAQLDLLRPIYGESTNYGHFGYSSASLPWEQVDKVDDLKAAL